MRKLSEIGKSFTKRRTESADFQSPTDGERASQSSSDEHKSRDSGDIVRPPPPPMTPDKKGRALERGVIHPPMDSPGGRTSLSDGTPGSPQLKNMARLSLSGDLHGSETEEEGKSKLRANMKRLSLKALTRSKSDHKPADKRVMNWIMSFSQFAPFASRFAFTTWDQLLGYTPEDLHKLGVPMAAVVPLSKIIAAIAAESAMEKLESERATTMPYALLQVPETRPRSFSYNNRAIATSEHVKTLTELFQDLDTESKGLINESELSVALQRYGVVDQEGAKAWFADIDSSQRGVIDQQQFVDFMTYVYPMIFTIPNPAWSPRGSQGEPPTIFLGGSCNPTSWRRDIVIPLLQKASISFFNPQVDEWYEALIAIEARAKASATLLFFVIDSLTLSLATMIECTELITSGRPLVLVINDLPADARLASGEPMPKQVLRDANRARAYMADVAVRHRIQPYSSISRATCELIQFLHGGWTGGGYETRPRATLAKKSEESWTNLKHKVHAAIAKMNSGRRGSLRGHVSELSAFSLPPPRTPERSSSAPRDSSSSIPPDLPYFSSSFPAVMPGSPPGPSGAVSPHGFAGASPPGSPSKMVPVSVLGHFPHLVGGSPPLRPSNHRSGSLSNMLISIPSLAIGSPARGSATSAEPRSLFAENGDTKPRGHTRKPSSSSSLADIIEGVNAEDLAEERKSISLAESIEPLQLPLSFGGVKTESPRSSNTSIPDPPDTLTESPETTPHGSSPSSFLSLSPVGSQGSSFG